MELTYDKKIRGNAGEDYVCEYLQNKGYEIICRNYRKRCGEIDVISKKLNKVYFVEVKTRKFGSVVSGAEAVNKQKQLKLVKTAEIYLEENDVEDYQFDVAEVIVTTDKFPIVLEINYIEDAFSSFYL